MSFKTNDFKQLSLDDRYDSQTQRVKNIVTKSWAKGFSDIVFPATSEDNWFDFSEYKLLIRVISEQTEVGSENSRNPKSKNEITTTSLQNPSDPDATYRKKGRKQHKGYVGNIVETA